jgi:hypothetical protein
MRFSTALVQTLLLGVLFLATPAQAAMITVEPAFQQVSVGDSVDVALNISGLGDGTAPSVGIFDLDVTWDATILALQHVTYGDPVLGDQLDPFGLGSVQAVLDLPGYANVFELSLDSPMDLDVMQADSFTMATLTFDTLAVGISPVDVTVLSLGDALGDAIPVQVAGGAVNPIPEPSPEVLFSLGAFLVAVAVSRRATRSS